MSPIQPERKHRSIKKSLTSKAPPKRTKSVPSFDTTLEVKVQAIEVDFVILDCKELGELQWPLTKFPIDHLKEGEILQLSLAKSPKRREVAAKNGSLDEMRKLLEELLN